MHVIKDNVVSAKEDFGHGPKVKSSLGKGARLQDTPVKGMVVVQRRESVFSTAVELDDVQLVVRGEKVHVLP